MSYNSETGIISAPVSIDDVKQALGESSNDLATLCKSENINIWSKYKPISCKGEFKEYPIREDSDEIVTSSYNKYTCVVRCGMNIPMDTYKNLRNNYGEEGFAINGCYDLYLDNIYGQYGTSAETTTMVSGKHFPKGGANSPYRLSDFRNYNSKAKDNRCLTSLSQCNNVDVYYSSTLKFNCVLYVNTNVDNNTNLTMDDIITDLSLAWSFWIQICYDSPYNTTDKIYKNYYVGNCKKPTDYIYAGREITFDIGSGDKVVTIVPFLAYTRNATLYDDTRIIFISLPSAISFKYYPRQIYMESIKSGSSGFVDFSSLRQLVGATCICKTKIYKLPDGALTVTDGMFRSVCTYGNNKTTYGRGYVSNSSGQNISSITIPNGDKTHYLEVYIRFDNVYDGGYYGQICQLSFEFNIDGGWKQVPPGGSYIMN
jgi:hypothetical protein